MCIVLHQFSKWKFEFTGSNQIFEFIFRYFNIYNGYYWHWPAQQLAKRFGLFER